MHSRSKNSVSCVFWASAGLLAATLVLGGGTKAGFLSDLLLQLAAVPVLAIALWGLLHGQPTKVSLVPLVFCAMVIAMPLLQLVPLPAAIWAALPNRAAEAEVFQLVGERLPWRPMSMVPSATWFSLLSLTVPVAVFLSVIQLTRQERRWLTLLVVGISALAVILGLSQLAVGKQAAIRFFELTNESEATGFFANRNHFAALLYCAFLFAAVWAMEVVRRSDTAGDRSVLGPDAVVLLVIVTILVGLIAGQAMARSRAGIALGIVAIAVAVGIAVGDRRRGSKLSPTHVLGGVLTIGFVLIGQFALYRIAQRFGSDPFEDARRVFSSSTIAAAQDLMPTGSGLGTFVPVFALYEKATDLIPNVFANRAHNDWLEFWLEAGLVAILCICVFLAWLAVKSFSAWRRARSSDEPPIDIALRRASIAIVGLLIAHSLVDYPLRTAAMASVFAFACGIIAIPTKSTDHRSRRTTTHVRYPPERQNSKNTLPARKIRPRKDWRPDHDWPEAWR